MKLYVGNLSYDVDDAKLNELFSKFGEVEEAKVIQDNYSGRSKGFGFVTFKDDAVAKKAIAEMNEKEIEGRQMKVNEAKPIDPNRPKPNRNFGGGRGSSGRGFNRSGSNSSFGGNRKRF